MSKGAIAGTVIGTVESLVQIEPLVGLRKTEEGATLKEYAPIPGMEADYATQTIVDRVVSGLFSVVAPLCETPVAEP